MTIFLKRKYNFLYFVTLQVASNKIWVEYAKLIKQGSTTRNWKAETIGLKDVQNSI